MAEALEIRPQPGPQEEFHASPADIVVYGGAAGGGKSFAIITEPLRHADNPRFGGAIFRRESPQLVGVGSLWEEAQGIYPRFGAKMVESPTLHVDFPSGAQLQFLHLQHDKDKLKHQGKQYAYIAFDELTHFTESQFWYLVSRMRSVSGVRPYMRCTCNPDPDSFVRHLVDWWIDEDGYAIPERSGVVRCFVRQGNVIVWGESKEELAHLCDGGDEPMSFTFIAASLEDNPALLAKDPGYRSRLKSLDEVNKERLLRGNWNIRPSAGKYIRDGYFQKRWHRLEDLPPLNVYTSSDYAVTEEEDGKDPDYTEHGVFGVDDDDYLYVLDWWYGQEQADVWIERLIDKWAQHQPLTAFGEGGVIRQAVEPFLKRRMLERKVYCTLEWINAPRGERSETKEGYKDPSKRAKARKGRAFQARAAMGKIIFPANAPWVDRVISQCVGFPSARFDDAFDVMALMCMAIDQAEGRPAPTQKERRRRDIWAERKGGGSSWKTA